METLWIAITSAALLASVGFVLTKGPFGAKRKWRDPFEGFEGAIRGVEQTEAAYFHSLELMLTNLETVRARTEQAEQRLWGIVTRPGIEWHTFSGADGARKTNKRNAGTRLDPKMRTQIASARRARRGAPPIAHDGPLADRAVDFRAGENKRPRFNGTAE